MHYVPQYLKAIRFNYIVATQANISIVLSLIQNRQDRLRRRCGDPLDYVEGHGRDWSPRAYEWQHVIALQLLNKPCDMLLPIGGHKTAERGAKKMLTAARPKKQNPRWHRLPPFGRRAHDVEYCFSILRA